MVVLKSLQTVGICRRLAAVAAADEEEEKRKRKTGAEVDQTILGARFRHWCCCQTASAVVDAAVEPSTVITATGKV